MIPDRFWAKVDKTDTCWNWTAGKGTGGYGRFWWHGRYELPHRVMWEWANGATIHDGLKVMHDCDNPSCVRPDHLVLGTQAANIADKVAKGRQARGETHGSRTKPWAIARGLSNGKYTKPECTPRGERHGQAKLTQEQVNQIRQSPHKLLREISAEYGIAIATASNIRRGKIWKESI